MTTGKIEIFERLAYRARMLNYGLIFFRENEQTLRTSFDRAKSEGRDVHADNFDEFTRLYLQSVVYGELALFWGAFDAYCYKIYGRTNGFNDIRARTKEFRVKCHRRHNDRHLLTILKAVRDREIH